MSKQSKVAAEFLRAMKARTAGETRDCPSCKKTRTVAILSAADAAKQTDGTVMVCHPLLGGCNAGFAV